MTFFDEYLRSTDDRLVTKWLHYLPIFEKEMAWHRDKPISFLEIGIYQGGSIPMWKAFFAKGSQLTFIDIDPKCKKLQEDGTSVEIGDQSDDVFLKSLIENHGPFDIIIDDGSHVCSHQIKSFETLWPAIREDGLYIVEDCHTSYWREFSGGFQHEGSFIEYVKGVIDRMHSWYSEDLESFPFDPVAKEIHGLRIFDSLVMLEKKTRHTPPTAFSAQKGVRRHTRQLLDRKRAIALQAGKSRDCHG